MKTPYLAPLGLFFFTWTSDMKKKPNMLEDILMNIPIKFGFFSLFFLRLVSPILPVSVDCPCLIALSVFSDIHFLFAKRFQRTRLKCKSLRTTTMTDDHDGRKVMTITLMNFWAS